MQWITENSKPNGNAGGPRDVVVTGATGFVGGQLLKRLLGRMSHGTIVCPVRATSDTNALERGHQRMVELLGPEEALRKLPRVEFIRADLEDKNLGWDSFTWRRVASQTVEIYHCAASVTFDLPLDEAHRINVDGTIHIHNLAVTAQEMHGGFKRFHHVSTAFVAGKAKGTVTAAFLPPDNPNAFRNTYERTKARAERYLRAQATSGAMDVVPVSIYRPSIVAGDTETGETDNWNVLYVPMKMAVKGSLPVFSSGGRALCDSVGVDFVVDGMLALGRESSQPFHSFHLTAGPTAFTVDDLIAVSSERAAEHADFTPSHTKMLSPRRWTAMVLSMRAAARLPKSGPAPVAKLRRTGKLACRGLGKCDVYIPYTRVNVAYNTAAEHKILRRHGVSMPDGLKYLTTAVDYALATDFGKRPVPTTVPTRLPGSEAAVPTVAVSRS